MMSSTTPDSEQELDFVALGNAMGYKNPMYLPQEFKNCIGAALKFIQADRLRTAKEARIDEWEKAPLETALPQGGKRRFFYISNHYRKQRLAELQENTDEA